MSRLRIYWPEAVCEVEAAIVPFPAMAAGAELSASFFQPQLPVRTLRHPALAASTSSGLKLHAESSPAPLSVVDRARVIYANRCCPECQYPVVEPVELDDAIMNRNGQPIPGSATLVGFRCEACDCEWSVR